LSVDNNQSIQYLNNVYQIEDNDLHLEFDGEKCIAVYDLHTDSLLQKNLINEVSEKKYLHLENKLKAIIQTYNQRMISNRLTAE